MATTAAKGLNKAEMKLLNDFANTVNAREFTSAVSIEKISLTYTAVDGFSIELIETKLGSTPTNTTSPVEPTE